MRKKRKKKLEPKCKNCRLFDEAQGLCRVIILYAGEKTNLPVDAEDDCFFEGEFTALNEKGKQESFRPEVQQVKFWTEDPKTGKKTDKDGVVKIEYPEGFFGDEEKAS